MLFIENTPYTYLIGWTHLNIWYCGCRYARDCHPKDFWVTYFTSSVYVSEFIKKHGEPDYRSIRKIFTDEDYVTRVKRCQKWEDTFIRRVGAVRNDNWLNKSRAGKSFQSSGMTTVVDPITNKNIQISIKHPDFINGKLNVPWKGTAVVNINDGKNTRLPINDYRVQEKIFRSPTLGKTTVYDHCGVPIRTTTNDPRIKSGELSGKTKGKVLIKNSNGEIFYVKTDDERILTGEFNYLTNGMMCVKDKYGNTFQAAVNDPLVLSGEWVHHSKGEITVYTPNGTKVRTCAGDPRLTTGELIHPLKGSKKPVTYCHYCQKDIAGSSNYSRSHGAKCVCNPDGVNFNQILHDFILFTTLSGDEYKRELKSIKKKLKKYR